MTTKIKILGTGLTGLVGSRIVELLKVRYEFENLSLETGIDITQKEQVKKIITDSPARVVLHLAAKADVDGCEEDKEQDLKILRLGDHKKFVGLKTAWAVNVEGTRNILEAAKESGKKIIYISTDFVFDGTPKNAYLASRSTSSPARGASTGQANGYTEEDKPNPINWYGVTKYEGERVVIDSELPYLICRIAFPYRANFDKKRDFLRGILEKLKNGEKIMMVSDKKITPTFIDDIAFSLEVLIRKNLRGIYHLVGESSHTPLEAAYLIAKMFGFDESLINSTTRETYFAGRAPRPFSLVLKNDKLKRLGVRMSTFEEGLEKVKNQLRTNN